MRLIFMLYPVILLCLLSCGKTAEHLMQVKGTVKGLKKGVLYLQKVEDSTLVNIDSLTVDGNSDFSFTTPLESPEFFYLYLDKNDNNTVNDRIMFFGEQGTITINTTRDFFEVEASIEGSASHKKWEEYRKTMSRFSSINLDLIEALLNAQKNNDTVKADSIRLRSEKNGIRSYLYALNFALNNTDSYVAPYIALFEVPDTQIKYLDSIHRSLTPEIADSKYGKALGAFITKAKAKAAEK